MTEKQIYTSPLSFGKCMMQELKWQNMKCSKCGAELPKYPLYDNKKNEIKTCENCGKRHIMIRHI